MNRFGKSALALCLLLICVACVTPPPRARRRYTPPPPEPCMVPVAPIRFQTEVVAVTINTSYNAKDINGARSFAGPDVINELNSQSRVNGDSNTFVGQNGQQQNFSYVYTVNNDGAGHFTGSLYMTAWGGMRHTFNTGYSYTDAFKMLEDLTDQSYAFIHGGWRDSRTSCP